MAGPILRISGVTIGITNVRPPQAIVRDVTISVAPGEAVGIVGESGSGKSLTAQAIGGMLQPNLGILSGHIVVDGVDMAALSERRLHEMRGSKVAYVFQDPLNALNPTRSVGNHLIDVVRRHKTLSRREATAHAIEALRSVGISQPEERLAAFPHEMSGGMRQRLLIAMSLLCEPKLLIADEPTTALDVTIQARIIELFREIQARGISMVFISHNLDLVLEFCDAINVMYGGRIVEQGSAVEIGSSARHPYTAALMQCIPRLDEKRGRLSVIPGAPPTSMGQLLGCPFAKRCDRVQERCWHTMPLMTPQTQTHAVACWNPLSPVGAQQ